MKNLSNLIRDRGGKLKDRESTLDIASKRNRLDAKVLQSWLAINVVAALVYSYSWTLQPFLFLFIQNVLSVEEMIVLDQSNQLGWFFLLNHYKLIDLSYLTSLFEVQVVQDVIYHSDKSHTYIRPSIKIYLRTLNRWIISSYLSTFYVLPLYRKGLLKANINISRVKAGRV